MEKKKAPSLPCLPGESLKSRFIHCAICVQQWLGRVRPPRGNRWPIRSAWPGMLRGRCEEASSVQRSRAMRCPALCAGTLAASRPISVQCACFRPDCRPLAGRLGQPLKGRADKRLPRRRHCLCAGRCWAERASRFAKVRFARP